MSGQLHRNSNHEATRKRGGNSIQKGGNMNVAIRLTFCSAMLATLFTSTAIAVSDGETAFMSIYGERIKQVTKTADTDDDSELAGTLLRDLIQVKDSTLRHVMLTSAFDLGVRSDSGLESANRAVDLLAAEFPVPAADVLSKRRQLAELVYAGAGPNRADAAKTLIAFYFATAQADAATANDDAAHRWMTRAAQVAAEADLPDVGKAVRFEADLMNDSQQVQQKIDAIKSDASKKSECVKLLLTERGDAKAAEVAAKGLSDETLSRIIQVAGTDLKEVQPDDLLFAGDWYMRQSENASQAGKLICLGHAHQYYERFLVLRQTVDETRLRSESAMRTAESELAKLNAQRLDNVLKGNETISVVPNSIDLLSSVDVQRDTVRGVWRRTNGGIRNEPMFVPRTGPLLKLPKQVPYTNYRLRIEFARLSGHNAVFFGIPCGAGHSIIGLDSQQGDGQWVVHVNNNTRPGRLDNNKDYVLEATVIVEKGTTNVSATLNGEKIAEGKWLIENLRKDLGHTLTDRGIISLGCFNSVIELRKVVATRLNGK